MERALEPEPERIDELVNANVEIGRVRRVYEDEPGGAGLAPAIHKIVEGPALEALFRKDPMLRSLESPWWKYPDTPPVSMVLMDVATDGSRFMQWDRSRRSPISYPPAAELNGVTPHVGIRRGLPLGAGASDVGHQCDPAEPSTRRAPTGP